MRALSTLTLRGTVLALALALTACGDESLMGPDPEPDPDPGSDLSEWGSGSITIQVNGAPLELSLAAVSFATNDEVQMWGLVGGNPLGDGDSLEIFYFGSTLDVASFEIGSTTSRAKLSLGEVEFKTGDEPSGTVQFAFTSGGRAKGNFSLLLRNGDEVITVTSNFDLPVNEVGPIP